MQDLNKYAVAFAVVAVAVSAYLYYTNSKDDVTTTSKATQTVPAANTTVNAESVKAVSPVDREAPTKTPTNTGTETNSSEGTNEGSPGANSEASDDKTEAEEQPSGGASNGVENTAPSVPSPEAVEK